MHILQARDHNPGTTVSPSASLSPRPAVSALPQVSQLTSPGSRPRRPGPSGFPGRLVLPFTFDSVLPSRRSGACPTRTTLPPRDLKPLSTEPGTWESRVLLHVLDLCIENKSLDGRNQQERPPEPLAGRAHGDAEITGTGDADRSARTRFPFVPLFHPGPQGEGHRPTRRTQRRAPVGGYGPRLRGIVSRVGPGPALASAGLGSQLGLSKPGTAICRLRRSSCRWPRAGHRWRPTSACTSWETREPAHPVDSFRPQRRDNVLHKNTLRGALSRNRVPLTEVQLRGLSLCTAGPPGWLQPIDAGLNPSAQGSNSSGGSATTGGSHSHGAHREGPAQGTGGRTTGPYRNLLRKAALQAREAWQLYLTHRNSTGRQPKGGDKETGPR